MVRPKKHLGQHFLTDTNIAEKIVKQLSPDTVNLIEIGPGTGVLTKIILEKGIPNFYVIDIDHESIEYLKQNFRTFLIFIAIVIILTYYCFLCTIFISSKAFLIQIKYIQDFLKI